jgi:hypothetical protein
MKRSRGWQLYVDEVSHYFDHEPGVPSSCRDRSASTGEPRPPTWPAGANHYVMVVVTERLHIADQLMPLRAPRYIEGRCVYLGRPSCSMVLRAAFGTLACKYNDCAPDGLRLLAEARGSYIRAARRLWEGDPAAGISSTWNYARGGPRLDAQWEMAFSGMEAI